MARHDLRDLLRVHEHPADLRGLVGPPDEPGDARPGPPARARVVAQRHEVEVREPKQRPVRVRHGRHDLTGLAHGDGLVRVEVEDLQDLVGVQVHALGGPALVGGQQAVGAPVDLPDPRAGPFLELRARVLGESLRRDERDLQRPVP